MSSSDSDLSTEDSDVESINIGTSNEEATIGSDDDSGLSYSKRTKL